MAARTSAPTLSDDSTLAALLAELRDRYAKQRPHSRALYERARASLPGGNSRTQLDFSPFPFYVAQAQGPYCTDVDDIRSIDLLNNFTSLVHGHAFPPIVRRLVSLAPQGTAYGAPSPLEIDLAEEICNRVPSIERVRFTNSGTEAALYAIRAARLFTGREDVAKIEGGYNGGAEALQVSVKHLGLSPNLGVAEEGVPAHVAAHTLVLPLNDTQAAVDMIRRHGSRLAAVVVEPVIAGLGFLPAKAEYLSALRQITNEVGALLVFDEVMTLRLAYGGAQDRYGITPDLTIMGKIIGGGLPVGAFGGRADVMAVTDPRGSPHLTHSGTFNANPMTMAAGLVSLRELTHERIESINQVGERIRDFITAQARAAALPLVATGVGSILQVHWGTAAPRDARDFAARPRAALDALFYLLLEHGVFIAPRGRALLNVSTVIGDAELKHIEDALGRAITSLANVLVGQPLSATQTK